MEGILEPIRLDRLLDEAHLEALKAAVGRDAGGFMLTEPSMRDFGIIMAPRDDEAMEDAEFVRREAFAVSVCIRDEDGKRPIAPDLYLKLPGSTGRKLGAITTAWVLAIHKEANKGLGKKLEGAGLISPIQSDEQSSSKSGSSS